jgi:hypothetical protein
MNEEQITALIAVINKLADNVDCLVDKVDDLAFQIDNVATTIHEVGELLTTRDMEAKP